MNQASSVDLEATLRVILKSHDRIGFGRLGVLDAEDEIHRLATRLSPRDRARLRDIIASWLDSATAARVVSELHYNLPEHLQGLAINLCASVPFPEMVPRLRQLHDDAVFGATNPLCRDALHDALAHLRDAVDENDADAGDADPTSR